MKFAVKKLPKSEVEIIVSDIDEEMLKKYEKQSLQELSSKVAIKGFREGKVPEAIARKHISEEMLQVQIIHNLLPDIWVKAVQENKIHPIGEPKITIESVNPVQLKWTVPTRPELKIGNFKKIKVSKNPVKITEKDLEKVLEDMKKRFSEPKAIEREIKKGDRVEIDFEGKTPDGVPLEGTSSKNHPIIVGENTFLEDFEKQLLGMKNGGEKEFEMTFPKDYHAKNMAGKKVIFKVLVKKAEELIPPEINKEFSKKILGKELEKKDFEKEIMQKLTEQEEAKEKNRMENEYFGELVKLIEGELPDVLIQEEQEAMIREMKQRILYQGLSFDHYLKHIKKTEDELKESLKKEAEERVRLELGIYEISKLEKVTVSEKEIEEELQKMLERREKKEQDDLRKRFQKGTDAYASLEHRLRMQKTLHLILPQ